MKITNKIILMLVMVINTIVEPSAVSKVQAKVHYLYTLASDKGHIKRQDDGSYVLHMDDIKQVIAFSDRPYRIVKAITVADLEHIWHTGKDSFEVDPPNAVLSSSTMNPHIVELTDYVVIDKAHISFKFKPEQAMLVIDEDEQKIQLTIDDYS